MTKYKTTLFAVLAIVLAVLVCGAYCFRSSAETQAATAEKSATQMDWNLDTGIIEKRFPVGFSIEKTQKWELQASKALNAPQKTGLLDAWGKRINVCTQGDQSKATSVGEKDCNILRDRDCRRPPAAEHPQ